MAAATAWRSTRPTARWRGWLSSAWQVSRWPLFGVAIVAAFLLGYVGFEQYFVGRGNARGATDLAYLSLQLFMLESGSVPERGAPWQLEIARLLAPATTATAIAVALAAVFREELEEVQLRLRRGHIVVCGLGERGARLARSLLEAGHRVVAVELDPAHPAIPALRRGGAIVVVGDARSTDTLRRARVGRAAYVIAATSGDDANAEVAIQAGKLAPDRGPALTCLAHVQDPGLCSLLRSEELAAGHSPGYRLDFFNVYERGARILLDDHPPTSAAPDAPRLVIVGLTPLGRAVIVEAARRWRENPGSRGRRMRLRVIDPEADEAIDMLEARYPDLGRVAELERIGAEPGAVDVRTLGGTEPWHGAYVCIGDASVALDTALRVRRILGDRSIPVVVELSGSTGLGGLLRRPTGYEGLHPFDLLERTLRPELLLGGTYEILAQAIHAEYVDDQVRRGVTPTDNPSAVPWQQLPESLRESNRDQAAHIGLKLAAIGYGIAPLGDGDAHRVSLDEAEVERLAELEHERWTEQRRRDGWRLGPKDVEARVSPYLVPWTELADEVRELDRQAVRGIPGFLARAGYQVVRASVAGRPAEPAARSRGADVP